MFAFIGSAALAGITTDGLTPPGIIISGGLQLNADIATAISLHTRGGLGFQIGIPDGAVGNGTNGISVIQAPELSPDGGSIPLFVRRLDSDGGGYAFIEPIAVIDDQSSQTSQPMQQWKKNGTTQVQVDSDGLVIHSKFKTGASAVHILGAYSGISVPIYDESGTLLGYMPLYA